MPNHVLLVDDSATVRTVIPAELREAGFCVTPVPTLDGARRALAQSRDRAPFDLAILDLQLPDGDGLDLLRELRRDPDHAKLPVMILSSDVRFVSRLRGLGIGADDFLGKPHSKAYLIQRARALTGTPSAGEEELGRPCRALVIDADPGFRETLARVLRIGHGCEVVALESMDHATQYLEVDGAWIDCAVVERGCFLRIRALLQARRNGSVPVVVLDDSPAATPARRGSLPSREVSFIPRSAGPSAVAEVVLRKTNPKANGLRPISSPANEAVDPTWAERFDPNERSSLGPSSAPHSPREPLPLAEQKLA
jgi:DNA-binding response OmpR family regulator